MLRSSLFLVFLVLSFTGCGKESESRSSSSVRSVQTQTETKTSALQGCAPRTIEVPVGATPLSIKEMHDAFSRPGVQAVLQSGYFWKREQSEQDGKGYAYAFQIAAYDPATNENPVTSDCVAADPGIAIPQDSFGIISIYRLARGDFLLSEYQHEGDPKRFTRVSTEWKNGPSAETPSPEELSRISEQTKAYWISPTRVQIVAKATDTLVGTAISGVAVMIYEIQALR